MTGPDSEFSDVRPSWNRYRLLVRELERAAEPLVSALSSGPTRAWAPRELQSSLIAAVHSLRRRSDGTGDLLAPSSAFPGAVCVMGVTPEEFLRRLLGRARSRSEARHDRATWCDLRRGLLGPIHPPGTAIQILAGATLTFRMRDQDRVGLLLADAAQCATGAWHEGLNFASVRRCPMVVVVPEPRVGGDVGSSSTSGIPPARPSRVSSWLETCEGYGIRGRAVPVGEADDVYTAVKDAVDRARAGAGVQLVELRGTVEATEDREDPESHAEVRLEVHERVRRALRTVLDSPDPEGRWSLAAVVQDHQPEPPWYRAPAGRVVDMATTPALGTTRTQEAR